MTVRKMVYSEETHLGCRLLFFWQYV